MHITHIGINGDGGRLDGSIDKLAEDLAFFQQCGYSCVELSSSGLDVILNGRVFPPQLDRVRAVTERFPLTYTLHPPNRLNLALGSDLALDKANFAANLEVCAALGCRVMVYHSGLIALERPRLGLVDLPTPDELAAAAAQEVEALKELMPYAAELGVTVAMENRDPHSWEVGLLRQLGRDPAELATFHGGMLIPRIVEQVEAVSHPNLGICLDLAHLFLATNQLGIDYLEAVGQAAPHLRHIHANDNFGRLDDAYDDLGQRNPYGEGDLHLPPGWGAIPLADALRQLPDYTGILILELRPRYRDRLAEALETMRGIVASV
jgi:sugar phosphate isomerase/epimerase